MCFLFKSRKEALRICWHAYELNWISQVYFYNKDMTLCIVIISKVCANLQTSDLLVPTRGYTTGPIGFRDSYSYLFRLKKNNNIIVNSSAVYLLSQITAWYSHTCKWGDTISDHTCMKQSVFDFYCTFFFTVTQIKK